MSLRDEGKKTLGFDGENQGRRWSLERENVEFGSGSKWGIPVFNKQQKSGPIALKHVSEHSGIFLKPLGRF